MALLLVLSLVVNLYLIYQMSIFRRSQDSLWYDLQVSRIIALQQLSTRLDNVLEAPDNEVEVSRLIGDFATTRALSGNMNVLSQESPELRESLDLLSGQAFIIHERYFLQLQFRNIGEEELQKIADFQTTFAAAISELEELRLQALESGNAERYIRENISGVVESIRPYLDKNEEIVDNFRTEMIYLP
ncbi:hypothetical protein [Dethiobacter alkaliphilus]|uniref:hypothetical protein n=1 Tax=Dethiobacter alkaliphilus TaxID=427926 RepID=UPI00222656D3|nr:hypothetical protein [Dethiobacter alkaliphilus]MCW3490763.1 hypothetical protein [Dethiobacter alkaliphilus]